MRITRHLFATGAFLLAASSTPTQDLLGITWGGVTVRVNSYSGAVTPLNTVLQGANDLARAANGVYWAPRRISTSSSTLMTIDPVTGAATTVFFTSFDLRGLAAGPGNNLYGIKDNIGSDVLVLINTSNGVMTQIGSVGYDGVQGLAAHQGVLYAWDVFAGLLIVDPTTGAATDPFPGVGGPVYLQALCSHPDGRLLVGGGDSGGPDSIYSVNLTNGATTLIGAMTGAVDVRGLAPLGGYTVSIGQGCNGAFGPVALSVTGSPQVGGSLLTVSTNHAPNSIGLVVFGSSTQQYLGAGLPALLDPLFGTSNCTLYTSIDGSFAVVSGPAGPAQMQFGFGVAVGASGARVNMQHVCLEAVPGGMSWSNAVSVQIQ